MARFVGFKSQSSGIMLLGTGRGDGRELRKRGGSCRDLVISPKDSFFQIMYKNRMDVRGERTARNNAVKGFNLANVSPPD